ncbi:Hpt domain-containing protein [uncultured Agrobacterium sp.]|uniref:Hpt domain-containing protein n=1 Tax=uncultured Agrobacterium sp. TaxID=157277 RepID=UPI0025FF98B5|nr:Hpt domain-containing protein [uncultured Agrobacterium sp.]
MAALSIAFEAPDNHGGNAVTARKPIDFAHLAGQTKGDKDIEIAVLQLFSRQVRSVLQELAVADQASMRVISGRLKGSADAVGAYNVSAAAEALENGQCDSAVLAKLSAAVVEAENFILKLCR